MDKTKTLRFQKKYLELVTNQNLRYMWHSRLSFLALTGGFITGSIVATSIFMEVTHQSPAKNV